MRRLALLLLALPALAAAQQQGADDEPVWTEEQLSLPAPPAQQALLEVALGSAATHRAFIDAGSLSVASDGVVRYTLVMQSPSGARNVSYEGLRCKTKERKAYAFGRADGAWSVNRHADWMPIEPRGANSPHPTLFRDYLCQDRAVVRDAAEAARLLGTGGRPRPTQ